VKFSESRAEGKGQRERLSQDFPKPIHSLDDNVGDCDDGLLTVTGIPVWGSIITVGFVCIFYTTLVSLI